MYNYRDGDYNDNVVNHPDILSTEPILEGEVTVKIIDWDEKEMKMYNPTWKDIATFFTEFNDGHHIYFEDVRVNEMNDVIEIISGS